MVITIHVDEGRQYRIGDITITGCKLYHRVDAQAAAPAEERHDLPPRQAGQGRGEHGGLLRPRRLPRHPGAPDAQAQHQPPATSTSSTRSRRATSSTSSRSRSRATPRPRASSSSANWCSSPGDVFDTVRMKASKLRLENTRLLRGRQPHAREHEHPRPPQPQDLREGGAAPATSALAPATARWNGRPSSPRSASPISTCSTATPSSRAPARNSASGSRSARCRTRWSCPSRSRGSSRRSSALGFNIYRTSSDYTSSYYEEIRIGAEVYLRKHLFEYVEGRLP